jgi:serine/threonine protein kinase
VVSCLDEDSILAFVDGAPDGAERTAIESHLASCAPCADLVAASVGGAPEALSRQSLAEALATPGELGRGATVGRYVILGLVGRGGMGEVYAAYDPRLERKVALKLLRESSGRGASARAAQERLLREAQSIARLSHPNVVVVHDAGAIDDESRGVRVYLAMEFIEGQTLAGWLASEPRTWRAIRDVFVAAAEGLAAAHRAGLVHRDFNPQNVMVGRDGAVRVMDFGLANDASDAGGSQAKAFNFARSDAQPTAQTLAMTDTGVLLGTPLYMAPEQFLAQPTDARTDQFGFCTALYEALYGERPFPSDSLSMLVSAVVAGKVRAPTEKARVPTFLRRILLSGLAAAPASRYPSMRELIVALHADPVRRRRSVAIGAAVAMAVLGVAVGAQRVTTRGQRMCQGAADKLAGIWELDEDGDRRSAVKSAFAATGNPNAADTWTRVSGLLDDYRRQWTGAYTDACEATHVRGDQSAEVLDLRMSCLESQRSAFRALTDLFSRADGGALVQAVNAVHALPAVDRCSDISALRAVLPPPADPAVRARIAELEVHLAEIKALTDTGQWTAAHRRAGPLVEAARAIGYEPLLAEALSSVGWLEAQMGDPTVTVKTSEEAVWVALAAHRDDVAAENASQLVVTFSDSLGSAEVAARWQPLAEALVRRLGPGHERIAAWFHQDRGIVLFRAGQYQSAFADFETALSLKRKVLPPNHPDLAITLNSVATALTRLGKGEQALLAIDEALNLYKTAYGSRSPLIWIDLVKRGELFNVLHRYSDAEADLRLSVELSTALLGTGHTWTADPLTALGKTLIAEERYREASAVLERALGIREHTASNPLDAAETRFALARTHWALDRSRSDAVSLATAARDTYRKLPGHDAEAAEIDTWLSSTGSRLRAL